MSPIKLSGISSTENPLSIQVSIQWLPRDCSRFVPLGSNKFSLTNWLISRKTSRDLENDILNDSVTGKTGVFILHRIKFLQNAHQNSDKIWFESDDEFKQIAIPYSQFGFQEDRGRNVVVYDSRWSWSLMHGLRTNRIKVYYLLQRRFSVVDIKYDSFHVALLTDQTRLVKH